VRPVAAPPGLSSRDRSGSRPAAWLNQRAQLRSWKSAPVVRNSSATCARCPVQARLEADIVTQQGQAIQCMWTPRLYLGCASAGPPLLLLAAPCQRCPRVTASARGSLTACGYLQLVWLLRCMSLQVPNPSTASSLQHAPQGEPPRATGRAQQSATGANLGPAWKHWLRSWAARRACPVPGSRVCPGPCSRT